MEVGEVGQVGRVADPEMLNWDIGAECIVSFIALARDELYALFFFSLFAIVCCCARSTNDVLRQQSFFFKLKSLYWNWRPAKSLLIPIGDGGSGLIVPFESATGWAHYKTYKNAML